MKQQQPPSQNPAPAALTGALIPPETLAAFDDVVGRAVQNEPRCSEVPVAKLRPRLVCVPDLMDQVAEVLGGNPLAAERLRQTLASFGAGMVPTRIARAILEGDLLERPGKESRAGRMGLGETMKAGPSAAAAEPPTGPGTAGFTVRARWDRLLAPPLLEPLAAAAVYVSRDREELAVMLGGIELGLHGIDEMQTLFDLALSGAPGTKIASAFETARRVILPMGYTPGGPGSGAGPGGFGFEPPRGVPGWFGVPGFPVPGRPWPGSPMPGGGSPRPAPPPPPEPPRGIFLTEFFERCLGGRIIPELHRRGIGFRELVTGGSGHYVIDSVEPADACPGDTITIRGSNFDGTTAVHFVDDRGRTVVAPPRSVDDDRVTVVLPAEARTGPVALYIPVQVRLCLITHTTARPGTPGDIRVGRASILRFEVRHGTACVARSDEVDLIWSVLPDDAEVTITRRIGSTETVLDADAGASGEMELDTLTPGTHEYRIDVHNPSGTCEDASAVTTLEVMRRRATRFQIVGVEQTQGIQDFSLADPINSIDLIADMDTVLRVFVRTTYPAAGPLAWVSGVLRFGGNTYMPMNAPSPFIDASRAPDRDITNHSLNFLIPAADASGSGEATVEVFTTGSCADQRESWTDTLTWRDRPALPVTIRRIADSGPAPNVLTVAQVTRIVNEAFSRIPSPKTAIRVHPGVHQIREGTTEDNYCTDGGFYQLALSIAYEHNDNEGYPPAHHSTSWVGIYFQTGCDVSGMMSWPYTSTCITNRDPEIAAHEIMHTVGLGHTKTSAGEDCENVGQPVACHWLDHLTDGVLNHVPFDIANNTTVPFANDLQSYKRSPRWLCAALWVMGRNLMDTRY